MQVNIKQNGVDLAPMEWTQAQQMLAMGTLRPTDFVWDAKANEWVTLDHFSRQMVQPSSSVSGLKVMLATMGVLCLLAAIGVLVWQLGFSGGDDKKSNAKQDDKKEETAKGINKGKTKPKREVAGGSKRPEVPPVPDAASVVISIDTRKIANQAMWLPDLTRAAFAFPGGGQILEMLESDELTFPNDLPGVTWVALPPPALVRAGVSHVQVIYLPMDNNIAIQQVIEDAGHEVGELIEFENRGHFRAMISNQSVRAIRLGFDDHAMAVVMLMNEDNEAIFLENLRGGAEDMARESLNYLLKQALPPNPVPPSDPRLLAFLKKPSVGGIHMNFEALPESMFEKAFQRPDVEPGFKAFMNTVRQSLSLGMNVEVADGSATAHMDVWHDQFDGSVAGRGVPRVLLDAIPENSQIVAGISLNPAGVLRFLQNDLVPLMEKNTDAGQASEYARSNAMVQLATGMKIEDLVGIFRGDFVLALNGLENSATGRPPFLVVGATIASPQKLEVLIAALNRAGTLEELGKQGITVVQRSGCLFLCSVQYAGALQAGPLTAPIRGADRQLLAQNHIAAIVLPQKLGSILDQAGEQAAFLKNLRKLTLSGRLEAGRQTYRMNMRFKNPEMNLLQVFLKRGGSLTKRPVSNGSGFFITEDGYLITNNHVVQHGVSFKVKTTGGEFQARVIKRDPVVDLALMKVEGRFRAIPVVGSDGVQLGTKVFTIGFPKAGLQGVSPKFTEGSISSLKGMRDDPRHFQISVPVQPGNSGGPLINEFGNVVGVVVSQLRGLDTQNVNYAIKSDKLTEFLAEHVQLRDRMRTPPRMLQPPKYSEVVSESEHSSALILVYDEP